jgi:hypothetical protein
MSLFPIRCVIGAGRATYPHRHVAAIRGDPPSPPTSIKIGMTASAFLAAGERDMSARQEACLTRQRTTIGTAEL